MSFQHTLDGLFNKGKEKLQEFTNHSPGQQQQQQQQYAPQQYYQGPPRQGYPGNQYPPHQGYQQPQFNNPPVQQAYPPYNNPYAAHQHPQGSDPPPPPIPYSTRPGASPPIPSSSRPSPPSAIAPYWQANFDPSVPISQIFVQETGAHGWGNNESQNYTSSPENSFFTPDNKLVLRAIANSSSSGDKFTSARLFTHQKLDRQRGCLSAVITAPCAPGIWPAFWLLPANPFLWPNDGEIDIFESWNGDCVNHSCLHWGHYNGEDWNKHRVIETPIPSMGREAHKFDLAWEQGADGRGGRLVWYIDGNAVMKASIPEGTRRMSDWRIILNVAMGGNVCGGRIPADGSYDFIVHELKMEEGPSAGWGQFGADWERTREGKTM